MKRAKLALAAAVVLAMALALCPRTPDRDQVDPAHLLEGALASALSVDGTVQSWNCALNGRSVRSTPETWQWRRAVPEATMVALLKRNYTPLVEGSDTIAGRPAWVLRLRPHVKHRPWRQLWIDRETGVVLAMREWDSRNRPKRLMRTTSIAPTIAAGTRDPMLAPLQPRLSHTTPRPSYVPLGFELVVTQSLPSGGARIVYSDGLFPVTILIRFPDSRHREHTQRKRLHDWGQGLVLSMRRGDKEVTLVGDLPGEELERMALSLP